MKNFSLTKLSQRFIFFLLFLVLLICVVLGFKINSLKTKPIFPLKHIQVISTFEHLDPKKLQETIRPYTADGFFGLEAAMLKEKLMIFPWVHSVSIQRIWPDRIAITLNEQKAVAIWNENFLVNNYGETFTPAKKSFPPNLPQLVGSGENKKTIFQNYFLMNRILVPLRYSIAYLNVDTHHDWHIVLNNGLTLFLGQENIIPRLTLFVKAYPKVIKAANKTASVVDLRYSNGFTIKWGTTKNL